MTGVKQALVEQIMATVKEAYFADICNRTTNSINDTAADVLTHFQKKCDQLVPHELLDHKGIIETTAYHPRDPIATVFYYIGELLKLANITGTSYTQHQAMNISYMIIDRTGKYSLLICKCNCIMTAQKTWVGFTKKSDGASIIMRDTGPHRIRRENAQRKYGAQYGCSTAVIPA